MGEKLGFQLAEEKHPRLVEGTLGEGPGDQGAQQGLDAAFLGEVPSSCSQASVSLCVNEISGPNDTKLQ